MRRPFLRRVSSSRHGGWPLFCRLLLWGTRNSRACDRNPARAAERAEEPVRIEPFPPDMAVSTLTEAR